MFSTSEFVEVPPKTPAVEVVEEAAVEETKQAQRERGPTAKRASHFGPLLFGKAKAKEETAEETSSDGKLLGPDWTPRQQTDGASSKLRATIKARRRSRSWAEPSADEKVPLTSVLDHVTNAEDVFETRLFSDSGDQLTFIRNNLDWENRLLGSSSMRDFDGRDKQKEISISIDEFLARWKTVLEGREIPTQYLALLENGVAPDEDQLGPLKISSEKCDDFCAFMKLAKPFFPCLWSAKWAYGMRRHQHEFEGEKAPAVDIWYTVPLSVIVNGEGNHSLASSAIYTRYLSLAPQVSFVFVVLRYNWIGSTIDGRPNKDFRRLLSAFQVPQDINFETRRAKNGCDWHLAPQLAFMGMALGLWREGLEQLAIFAHEQERKMHEELSSNDRRPTTISIRSVHLRLKYLHEERESLRSFCYTLESLHQFWKEEAKKEGDETESATGVSAIQDLKLIKDEFNSQLTRRDELVERLSNVQNLYFNLTTSKIAHESKKDSSAMKAIAIVTTIFFPATFVATFMSMTFFQFGESQLSMSSSIWIFFLITVPLTVVILGGLVYWMRKRERREDGLDEEDAGAKVKGKWE